jgi:feruloyl-CoA synthase
LILQSELPLADYPANLLTWLHQNAEKYPNKPFLQERDEHNQWCGLTYAETLATVNRLSNGLVARGLTAGRPIAILSENCINMALIQFAAMQVGLPVTPISCDYSVHSQTGSLIKHILDVVNASMLVMSDACIPSTPSLPRRRLCPPRARPVSRPSPPPRWPRSSSPLAQPTCQGGSRFPTK